VVRLERQEQKLHDREPMVKRTVIATAWIAGATIPLILAAVFIFGCCVLPFHRAIHRVLPLCHIAIGILNGGHGDADRQQPVPPAPQKQDVSGPSLLTTLAAKHSLVRTDTFSMSQPRYSPVAHRNFISLGAVRCDDDVGLHRLLIETFRI
jgi:hypothetical protein